MTLILEKNKLIESFWQYRWFILQHRKGFVAKVLRKTQYKETRGKHKEIQPRDIIKAKKQGLPAFLELKRGYKAVWKWYVQDLGAREELPDSTMAYWNNNLDTFEYRFEQRKDLKDYELLTQLSYDHLVKLNFATLTWLSRNQPLKRSYMSKIWNQLSIEDELEWHFMDSLENIDPNRIRKKLKQMVAEDYADEEICLEKFKSMMFLREMDWWRKISDYCLEKSIKYSEEGNDEKQEWWFNKHEQLDYTRHKEAELQAIDYWKNGKKINIEKDRAVWLKRIDFDLAEISYL